MKQVRSRTSVVIVVFAMLCLPLLVCGQSNVEVGVLIQGAIQSEVLLGKNKSRAARLYTEKNYGLNRGFLDSPSIRHSGIDGQSGVQIRRVALDSIDGPPPCGKDGYCNLNACSADPDCPPELQQESESEPYEPLHNEKGIGGSVWFTTGPDGFEGGHSCNFDKGTCNIKVNWSVTPDKYDKWKICWKDWGDTFANACDDNEKIRKFENNFYVIPNLKEDHHYRIRLEGRKDKNDKWKCLAKARLRNVHLNGTNIRGVVPCIVP